MSARGQTEILYDKTDKQQVQTDFTLSAYVPLAHKIPFSKAWPCFSLSLVTVTKTCGMIYPECPLRSFTNKNPRCETPYKYQDWQTRIKCNILIPPAWSRQLGTQSW